jgi:arogenate/prephenate dehydratase
MTTIAYQGEPGAFSEAAAQQVIAEAATLPCHAFEDVFEAVESGRAAYGVLPIENSIGGSIHRNFDLLLEHQLPIVGQVEIPVVHHLLALPGVKLENIQRVYSHPQALAQCDRFLHTLKGVEIVATYDTAGSAKLIADDGLRDAAAVASARAAEVFGLTALRSGIQDYEHNTTRFLVIARADAPPPPGPQPADKTSVVFTLPNEAGALFKALSVFALRGISLTKLESRPYTARKWEYLFYVDIAAPTSAAACERALAHLAEFAPMLRVLGSYSSLGRAPRGAGAPAGLATEGHT